jgi:hypothetical protein
VARRAVATVKDERESGVHVLRDWSRIVSICVAVPTNQSHLGRFVAC